MVNYNGKIFPDNKSVLTSNNRAFRYGDSLFETIRMFDGALPFLGLHWQRLKAGMEVLRIEIPGDFSQAFFEQEIRKVTREGNHRIRLTVLRSGGGLYTPEQNEPDFYIEASELPSGKFEWNNAGLKTGICEDIELRVTPFSKYKTGSALPFIMASIFKKENELDDCLLLNERKCFACGSSANLFLWKNGRLFTPPLEEGCVAGTMRWVILNLAKKLDIPVSESEVDKDSLQDFEELFLSNAIRGIRWVEKVVGTEKVFINENTRKLHEELNRHLMIMKVRA